MDAPATLRGYELLPRNNYEAVMNHLANVGPLSVAVDASKWSFYSGGIFDSCDYSRNIEINHGEVDDISSLLGRFMMCFLFQLYNLLDTVATLMVTTGLFVTAGDPDGVKMVTFDWLGNLSSCVVLTALL